MEMEGWLSLYFIGISTVLVLWFLMFFGGKRNPRTKQLPPGPWTLPIIGSLHHLVGDLPHRRMMKMSRQHGPMMHLRLGEVPTVIVSSAEAAALVMKTNDLDFASRPHSPSQDIIGCGGMGIIFGPYGDRWRQMRKICIVELLSSKQVRRMEGVKANEIVFGGKFTRQDEYLHELSKVNELLGSFCLVDLFPSSRLVRLLSNGERLVRRSYGRIQHIITEIIEGRKAARASGGHARSTNDEDLLDVLLRLQEEDSLAFPLTTEIMGVVIFDIFGAATETTGTAVEWAMSELLNNPEAMGKAQQEVREVLGKGPHVIKSTGLSELRYMQMVIKEVLRLHPPAPLLVPRETREDCEIMGYNMPKGTNIFVNVFAISRDPKYWDNPEEFKPERFENSKVEYYGTHFEFTPFGAGRRQCPGILFAMSTVEIALANLLYHFDWMLPGGANAPSLDMSEKFGVSVRRKFDLQLIAIPYTRSKAVSI